MFPGLRSQLLSLAVREGLVDVLQVTKAGCGGLGMRLEVGSLVLRELARPSHLLVQHVYLHRFDNMKMKVKSKHKYAVGLFHYSKRAPRK